MAACLAYDSLGCDSHEESGRVRLSRGHVAVNRGGAWRGVVVMVSMYWAVTTTTTDLIKSHA